MIHFDIQWAEIVRIGDELGATELQIKFALHRALKRTASKLRTLSLRGLRDELGLKRLNALRKRLKSIKLRKVSLRNGGGVKLWYGLNDMPISWLRGSPVTTNSGAKFRNVEYHGGFIGRSQYSKGRTIFKRAGKSRLHIEEQLYPVKDVAEVYIEDRVFVLVESIFWPLFIRELAARVTYKIGAA